MSGAARILRIVADQAAAAPAASNPLAVSKADAWPNLSGPIWLPDMEARYIADPLLNAISFRGVGLAPTWTSIDSSAGTSVPLTDPEEYWQSVASGQSVSVPVALGRLRCINKYTTTRYRYNHSNNKQQ